MADDEYRQVSIWRLIVGVTSLTGCNFFNYPTQTPNTPPQDRYPKKPVAWLLGGQLISALKYIALYVAYKKKLDPRDWMQAEVYPSESSAEREVWQSFIYPAEHHGEQEFWFDYLADSGDGIDPTYAIAYLCLSDLYAAPKPAADQSASPDIRLEPDANHSRLLPRGAFLFVGGDTSYHIADYASLASRIQNPFSWAYNDLVSCGQQLDERPIFGLPGNHNYYDVIDGFNRQFRLPLTAEHVPNTAGLEPQLSLPGFKRQQRASYSALRLPFGWWFWAIDSEVGHVDMRQCEFFSHLSLKYMPSKKLFEN